ncbi:MAG: hypothetical protein A2162_01570 [Deltaproteobacteria bacterium RBG_13_52_11b]|nr:MAG: hypothetical protein A2162_01570 [Deltaproteobacteria bacterium RBG_13_52_11b]
MQANNLMLLCGAGLSIPAPSNLMSAVSVARSCYDKYAPIEQLPPALRDDPDALAGHFYTTGQFSSVFIGSLVPWNDLTGPPNAGHAAVSDFLITRAAYGALSANVDTLIENWAADHKIAMIGALDGPEAITSARSTSPLLKFHGCLVKGQSQTLWTQKQLQDPLIRQRIESCCDWMRLNLPGKDLLVVGFWSDWGYLNRVLETALAGREANSVTVIDPLSEAALQQKAPALWATLTGLSAQFHHVQASGNNVLEELRMGFSKVWLRKFFQLGRPFIEAQGARCSPDLLEPSADLDCEALYNLRRDGEGVPYHRAAQKKEPSLDAAQAAFAHLLLLGAGASRKGAWYEHHDRTIRVVQGGGQGLSIVQERYGEAPTLGQADIVVCAGSIDLGVPGKLVASGQGESIVRPARGSRAQWLTLERARVELQL